MPWQLSKQISKPLFEQTKLMESRKLLFWRGHGGKRSVRLHPRVLGCYKKLRKFCPLLKFEIITTFLCYLLDALTNKYNRIWSSPKNLMHRFLDVSKESSCYQEKGIIIVCSFQEEIYQL